MIRAILKSIFSTICSVALALSFFSVSSFASSKDNGSSEQYYYQKVYGSILDIAEKQQKRTIFEEPREYNQLLKASENTEYYEKVKVKEDAPVIKKIIQDNPSLYGGMYYHPENGNIVVQISKNYQEAQSKIFNKVKHREKIQFKQVAFSHTDINTAQDTIRESAPIGAVKALIPDVINNKLIVSLTDLNNESKEQIKILVDNPELIDFIGSVEINPKTDETSYGDPYPMGSRISRYFTKNGGRYQVICTAGYPAVDASDRDVLVTAGHCDDVGAASAWYQANDNSTSIGNWAFRTSSSDPNGTDKTSDAGYIRMSGKDAMPYVPYPSANDMTPITGVYVDDLVGDTVYMRGATSGTLTSGKIRYSGVDVWYGTEGYGYVRKLVFADYSPNLGGDSGGTVLTKYAWDKDLQSYTFKLAGTNSAEITIKGHSVIKDGTYSLYSPIWTTYNDLNLSGLYLVQ